jgi:protein LTV1
VEDSESGEDIRKSTPFNDRLKLNFLATRTTITRPRAESKEDKKTRKQAVKAERQARRVEKKSTKEQFTAEMHSQTKSIANKEKTRMKKL